ncbi:MAG: adaptor protein MecA [Candidatus Fimivivens sp.]
MLFRLVAPDRLKVVLTAQDVQQLDVDWESHDASEIKKLRRYLLGILAQVQSQTDASFLLLGDRLLIEIYPGDDGSATIYFVMEEKETHTSICEPVIFSFDDTEALICGSLQLFSLHGHRLLQSALYRFEQSWQLIIRPMDGQNGPAVNLLTEYGQRAKGGSILSAIIEEHCKPIIREHAIDMLSYYFS